MKIDHVYVRPDGVICACTVPVPEEPTNVCSTCGEFPCRCNPGGDWRSTKNAYKKYNQAIKVCKDSSVPFENQKDYDSWAGLKPDSFYPLRCEVEIVEQYWTGNALTKNSRLPDWMDLPKGHNYLGGLETRKIARLITDSKNEPVQEESQEDMLGEILQNYSDYRSDQGSGENIRPLITFIDEELEKFHITRRK